MTLFGSVSVKSIGVDPLFSEIFRQFFGLFTLVDENHNAANIDFTLDRALMVGGFATDRVNCISASEILVVTRVGLVDDEMGDTRKDVGVRVGDGCKKMRCRNNYVDSPRSEERSSVLYFAT
ncbi:hypothetical protein HG531_011796 [Fusarium graminearum]|nr:hypothetical protein HG531_011796 [Fusarium graminearum]